MEFANEVETYIKNERAMLEKLEEIREMLELREQMEHLEPKLAEIRTFELKLRQPAEKTKQLERVAREEKEKRKRSAEKMEQLANARKNRGAPPAKSIPLPFDSASSGQNV